MLKTVDIAAKVPLEGIERPSGTKRAEMLKTVDIAAKVPLEDIRRH